MDSSLGLNVFTTLFLSGTFLAALVAGLGGFAFGIIAAAVWLYILTPLQTAALIMWGKNEFFRLYESAKRDPAWFHMMLKASESGIIAPAELADGSGANLPSLPINEQRRCVVVKLAKR